MLFAPPRSAPAREATEAVLWLAAVDACAAVPRGTDARVELARRSLRAAIQEATHTAPGAVDDAWASRLRLCVLGGAAGRAVVCRAAALAWSDLGSDWERLAVAARRLADVIDACDATRDAIALRAQMLAAGAR
jgi:hypothetical protein